VSRVTTTARISSGDQTRKRLLNEALALFAEKGYHASTLQEIADRLEVTKAALYYYFTSKSAILEALLAPGREELNQLLDLAEQQRSAASRVATMIDGTVEMSVAQRRSLAVLYRDPAVTRDPIYVAHNVEFRDRYQRIIFGDDPTPTERAAFQLAFGLSDAVLQLEDLTDHQLRETLSTVVYRTLGLRRTPSVKKRS
jgi:AcrR family transcriptional regulator